MKPASEALRYDYPLLMPASVVMDVGAYHGHFATEMAKRYGCTVHAFEPVPPFFDIAANAVLTFPSVKLHAFGIGASARFKEFGVQNDSSGAFADSSLRMNVQIFGIDWVMNRLGIGRVDLLKLNCEGMEYEILTHILSIGWEKRFRNIQVQFHFNFPGAKEKWAAIHDALLVTHEVSWGGEPSYWNNYSLK